MYCHFLKYFLSVVSTPYWNISDGILYWFLSHGCLKPYLPAGFIGERHNDLP